MMLVALMLRPWMSIMESLNTVPRTLADDLLVTAVGPNHLKDIITATDATHNFLNSMGARVATQKSILLTNNYNTRQQLRQHVWKHGDVKIHVAVSFRDLGGHINLSHHASSTTLNGRCDKGADTVDNIARLPLTHEKKPMSSGQKQCR